MRYKSSVFINMHTTPEPLTFKLEMAALLFYVKKYGW